MPELGVASAQGLHLATLDAFTYPTDIEASTRWYVDDVVAPLIEIDGQREISLVTEAMTSALKINGSNT